MERRKESPSPPGWSVRARSLLQTKTLPDRSAGWTGGAAGQGAPATGPATHTSHVPPPHTSTVAPPATPP